MKLTFAIGLLLFVSFLWANAEQAVIRIPNADDSTFCQFYNQSYDIASYKPGEYLDVVVRVEQIPALREAYSSLIITQTEAELISALANNNRDIPGYRNYQQILQFIQNLQSQYPTLMNIETIGSGLGAVYSQTLPAYSGYNHQIFAVKVSQNVLNDEDEPAMYICGGHHAREPISVEVSLEILSYLVTNYGTDPFVTNLLDTTQIWVVPLLNPDGHKVVIDQLDVWWRKNIRDNNNNQQLNYDTYGYGDDGVDLNRNYGYQWGYVSASDNNNMPTYHGTGPFSEPETQAFKTLLESKPFIAGLSYHTYGQYVLYPYGYVRNLYAPDEVELRTLAEGIASQVQGQSSGFYDAMPSWDLYPVSGSLDDWAYGTRGIFAYTVEMAEEFIPSQSYIAQIVQQNLNGALHFFSRRTHSMLTGHVLDDQGNPIVATIHVSGLDDHPVPRVDYTSSPQFGSYYRLLSPGQYTVSVYSPGFQSQSAIVTINDMGITIQDFTLSAVEDTDIRIKIVADANTNEPIAGASVLIGGHSESYYQTDVNGNIFIQDIAIGMYYLTIQKEGFDTIQGWYQLVDGATFSLQAQASWFDSFETGVDSWNRVGSWNRVSSQAFEGTYSLTDSPTGNYQNDTESTCTYNMPIDISNATNVNLQFNVRYNISLDGDYSALEYSTDNQNWQALDYYNGISPWILKSYNLTGLENPNLYIRFRFTSNSNGRSDGIYIDNIKMFVSYYEPVDNDDSYVANPEIKFSVYPNPSNGVLKIMQHNKVNETTNYDIELYNLRGQLVKRDSSIDLTNKEHIMILNPALNDSDRLGSGVYLLKFITGGNCLFTKRIMILQ